MINKNVHHRLLALSAAALIGGIALPLSSTVQAASLFADTRLSTCTTPNCSATIIDQAVILSHDLDGNGIASTTPWDGQFYSAGDECVRIEVLSTDPANLDLVMHFVGPDLSAWRDDDSGARLYPRIAAHTTDPGRYTVVVGIFAPTLTNTNTRFKMSYGRYPRGNPNCRDLTLPLSTSPFAAPESEK